MTDDLGTAIARADAPKDQRTVADLIESMRPELERSLQNEGAADILARHYFTAIRYDATLRQCTPESLVGSLLLTAQCRLEPGPLGHVYLVPFRDNKRGVFEVEWILGYTGIIALGRRGGAGALRSSVVWDCDEYIAPWESEKGIRWTLKPGAVADRKDRVAVLVSWKDGTERLALECPAERVERARKASPAARKKSGPWISDEDAMWRKTGVRFARPWLPLSTELAIASAYDDSVVRGVDVADDEAAAVVDAEPAEVVG